ncbi:MAG: hypothetical protein GXO86_06785 [Chlorobi bacterium]|nr:hypothetical protein [Chlorobiota bacterium]
MLKKAGYIIVISLLIFSTVGFVISRHYCNNTLVSVAVDSPADKCSDNMNNNCCNEESAYIVLKTDFTQSAAEKITVVVINILNVDLNSLFEEVATEVTTNYRNPLILPIPGHNAALSLIQYFIL